MTRRIIVSFSSAAALLVLFAHLYIRYGIVDMPGRSYAGIPSRESELISHISGRLEADVVYLAEAIGGRSIYNVEKLDEASDWIVSRFRELGLDPAVQSYFIEPSEISGAIADRNEKLARAGRVGRMPAIPYAGPIEVSNIWVQISGTEFPEKQLVVGAHYDTVSPECPGADDNSSGVAGLLEIAGYLHENRPKMSVCLVAFTCEEYPVGGMDKMGSTVFLETLLDENASPPVGMISLEMLGYYATDPGSQHYPAPFSYYFPDRADFIGFVGDATSRNFVRSVVEKFRQILATIPSEGIAAPVWLAPDVMRSDHAPFIRRGIPGLMVTDTSNFRFGEHYHQPTDTPEKLDYIRMAYVVEGLGRMIEGFEYGR